MSHIESAPNTPEIGKRTLVDGSFVDLILSGVGKDSAIAQRSLAASNIRPHVKGPDDKVTDQQFILMLNALRRYTRDELFGLAARPLLPGTFQTLCSLMLHEKTLIEAMRRGSSFLRLVITDFRIRVLSSADTISVRIEMDRPKVPRQRALQGVVLFAIYNVLSWLIRKRIPLHSVLLAYDDRPYSAGFARSYRAPVLFDAPFNELCLARHEVSRPIMQDKDTVKKFLRRMPEILVLGYRDHDSLTEKVMALLRRQPGARMSTEGAAEWFAMSPATFRRRLRDEGSGGFQHLKDRCRREMACLALTQSNVPVDEISLQLGFAETSSFHRAFKRWTGQAPGEFRNHTDFTGRI